MDKCLSNYEIENVADQRNASSLDFFNDNNFCIEEADNSYELKANSFITENIPKNTKRAYYSDIKYFRQWAFFVTQQQNINVTEELILQFIFHHLDGMPSTVEESLLAGGWKRARGLHSLATVKRRLVSVTIFHKLNNQQDPCSTQKIKTLLAAFARKAGNQKKAKAITLQVLEDLLETCKENSLQDRRDKALLLFGFSSGGRRRSEIADAEIASLEESGNDYIFNIANSKTDQSGKGHLVPIKGRAAMALKEWLEASGIKEGKIFRSIKKGGSKMGDCLTAVDINRIVKKRCNLAGYDREVFSAHSLRSGFITESGKQNKPLGDTMAMSGHKSLPVAMNYYQAGNILNNQASNLAG